MAKTKIAYSVIRELKEFLSTVKDNRELLDRFCRSEKDFTRDRKLPFDKLVLLIGKLCKKTLSLELEQFFEELGIKESCSVSAFSQQRIKLRSTFFYWWNIVLWSSYYHVCAKALKRWKGYRIIAADGSNVSLIKSRELSSYFGGQRNQRDSFVQGKTFYYYDVLNELVLYPRISPYTYGEVQMAYDGFENLSSDMLVIYDRGFCSYKMFALHLWQEKEIKFIIRGNEQQISIKKFLQSRKKSAVIELLPSAQAIQGLRKSGFIITKNTSIKVRLIRVQLENSIEVLVTNLWQEEGHQEKEFKALYFQRWAVETHISTQKNIMQLEAFSGQTVESVCQDFYATVFIANLHSLLLKDAQATIDQSTNKRKYPMKINGNKSYARLRKIVVNLFFNNDTVQILQSLHQHLILDILPVRKNRSFPREAKNKPGKSKHRTYSNYKPSS